MIGVCISGGGAKIGFAVGVLEAMEEKGIKLDLAYGISSGSICTAALCYGDVDFLKRQLLSIKKREEVLKKQWIKAIWTLLTGMGKADGWYEMDTMRQKLALLPLEKPKIKGVIGFVRLQKGNIEYVSSHDKSKEEFLDAVQASCSIPAFMQSQRVGHENLVDGGVRDVLPLKATIKDSYQVAEIHVICLSPLMSSTDKIFKNIVQVAERSVDLLVNEILQNDYDYAELVNKLLIHKESLSIDLKTWLANKRPLKLYRYLPTMAICDTTDFRKESILKGIEHGREIAKKVLSNYPS